MSIDLIPPQVADWWWNYGFAETYRRVTAQQHGADGADAYNYFSSVIVALNALHAAVVPPVLAFGTAASVRYAHGLSALPALRCVGGISLAASGQDEVLRLQAVGEIT